MAVDEKLDADTEALLSALEAGELDGAERARAEALLARSPAARATYDRLARLRALTAALPDPSLPAVARRRVGDAVVAALDAGHRRRVWIAVAASTLAAAAVLIAWAPWRRAPSPRSPSPAVTERVVRTGAGEHRLLQIGDRATAFVGERSVVELPPDGPPRIVSGRVRFVVKPDRAHPWDVATAAAVATVHGNEFDVDVSDDATDVRVARGEVEVHNALGARTLWAGEEARARVGSAPRRIEHVVPIVIEGTPEIEARPRR
jgi:ferric-dicitrate binding protein FerR (iron transport regulator)